MGIPFDLKSADIDCIDPEVRAAVFQALASLIWKFPDSVLAVNIQVLYKGSDSTTRPQGYFQPMVSSRVDHDRFLSLVQQLFDDCTNFQKSRTLLAEAVLVGEIPQPPYSRSQN